MRKVGHRQFRKPCGFWRSFFGYCLFVGEKYTYTLYNEADGSQTLNINAGTNRLFVKHFTDGKLGLSLGVDIPVTPPAAQNSLALIDDTPGNDPIGKTADYHSASTSWLITGTDNNDIIKGGAADDQLEGRSGTDNLYGNAGNDRLYGDGYIDTASAIAAATSGQTLHLIADNLSGGDGNDLLVGRIASNLMFGGGDSDTLIGGADVDILEGDGLGLAGGIDGTISGGVVYDPSTHRASLQFIQTFNGVATPYARYSGLSTNGTQENGLLRSTGKNGQKIGLTASNGFEQASSANQGLWRDAA